MGYTARRLTELAGGAVAEARKAEPQSGAVAYETETEGHRVAQRVTDAERPELPEYGQVYEQG